MASSSANGLRDSSSFALSSTGRLSDMGTLRGQRSPSSTIRRATGYPARSDRRGWPGNSRPAAIVDTNGERRSPEKESGMTPHMRYGLIGVVIGLILLWVVGPVVGIIVIAAALAIPVIAYRMLSPSQRRRLRENRRRKQIGG